MAWEQVKQINFVSLPFSGKYHFSLHSQTTSEVGELGRGETVKMENCVLLTCALQIALVMPASGRRLTYSLFCLTPGNIIITVVMMCQCHLLYSSSFSTETIVSDTNIFLFASCFSQHIVVRRQNMVSGSKRNLGQRSQRLFLPLCFPEC